MDSTPLVQCLTDFSIRTASRLIPHVLWLTEFLSRFIVLDCKPYGQRDFIEVAVSVVTQRLGMGRDLAEDVARKVVQGSRDVRQAVQLKSSRVHPRVQTSKSRNDVHSLQSRQQRYQLKPFRAGTRLYFRRWRLRRSCRYACHSVPLPVATYTSRALPSHRTACL